LVVDTPAVNTANGTATVQVTAALNDDLSGVSSVQWLLINPSGTINLLGSCTHASGSALNGTYQCATSLPQFSEAGEWRIDLLTQDAVGNSRTYGNKDIKKLGFDSTFVNGP